MSPFDPSIFRVESLLTNDHIELAVAEFEKSLWDERSTLDTILEGLYSPPNLLEFIMSVSQSLSQRVIDQFPSTIDGFFNYKLLSRFSIFLHFLPYGFPVEMGDRLRECRASIALSERVLQSIPRLTFEENTPNQTDDESSEDELFLRAKAKSQRKKKQMRRKPQAFVDEKPFQDLGIGIPGTAREAEYVVAHVLGKQKTILEYFVSVLAGKEVAEAVKHIYISSGASEELSEPAIAEKIHADILDPTESHSDNKPSAYPLVQPMKAALYFESAEGFGDWRILISSRADRDLREARRTDARKFKVIVKKIKELSTGHFSDDNQKRLNGTTSDIPIHEAKMTRDLRLVYQVDCVPEYNSDVERQVIRVFGIYTHAQLDKRLWDSLSCQLSTKGKEYRRRCTFRNRPFHANDNVISPATFPAPEDLVSSNSFQNRLDLPQEHLEELHSLLALEKFVTLSQAFLNSIIADQDVAHVFDVSPQEKKIIEHPHSCYVLGRSGTGYFRKTTTMLFKMLGIERAWNMHGNEGPKPRQLFVTQSRVLAEKVEEYFSKLLQSLATGAKSLQELAEIAKNKKSEQAREMLVDVDDVVDWRVDLPSRFSLLEDTHFPLFITFERLCQMLELDIAHFSDVNQLAVATSSSTETRGEDAARWTLPSEARLGPSRDYITYATFLEYYWPHLPQNIIKGLDPALVYSEIMGNILSTSFSFAIMTYCDLGQPTGVIKGSEEALMSDQHFLDSKVYTSLSHRTQSTFATQRDLIYSIFQSYLKRKKERNEFDVADRTHTILRHLQTSGGWGKMVDYLYVDEAQDNLMIDALLLRSICRNPNGLFWAGDTAQTISVGSSFRFDDLKAFLFRVEAQNTSVDGRSKFEPESFQLAVNYRSHGGIVNCAHSVIQLISRFWPQTIDTLDPEKGVVDGVCPVFLGGWNQDSVRYEQFLFGASGSQIEFGAQQCILVRDEAARDKLREQVGEIGLIMTLYESKGLEFNDVLLYNFFQDSSVDLSRWRVVLNAVEETRRSGPAPRFDEIRHAGVCSDLKFLYVAITRARKNIWIVDCSEKCEPLRELWTTKSLVQYCTPGDVPHLASSSTPEEWAKQGRSLFQNKRYLQAMHCFERALLRREVTVAEAYYLREQARAVGTGPRDDNTRVAAFNRAADAFILCSTDVKKEKQAYLRNAAECYVRGGDDQKAAKTYEDAEEYTLSAQLYRKLGHFHDAVRLIQAPKCRIDTKVAERILDVVRLVWFRDRNVKDAASLFESSNEAIEFTQSYDLDIAQADLLEMTGNILAASEVHMNEGRTLEGIKLLLTDQQNDASMRRANEYLLQGLWQSLPLGLTSDNISSEISSERLLSLATQLNYERLESRDRDEAEIFRAILSRKIERLHDLGHTFHRTHSDNTATLLSLDHAFVNPPPIQVADIAEVHHQLQGFDIYIKLLKELYSVSDPCNKPKIQKLFGFRNSTEHIFILRPGTILYRLALETRARITQQSDEGIHLFEQDLQSVFKTALSNRLQRRVLEQNTICRKTAAFSPCLAYAASGNCFYNGCPQEHVDLHLFSAPRYNARVLLHLQQIKIFHTLYSLPDLDLERQKQQRYWLEQLYDALNPAFHRFGNLANLSSDIVEDSGLRIAKEWIRTLLLTTKFPIYRGEQTTFLSTVLKAARLAFIVDGDEASKYAWNSSCVSYSPDPIFIRPKGGGYVVAELVQFLHGQQPSSVSAGIVALSHIVNKQLNINVTLLCDLIEYVCASLIWYNRQTATLHGVTLPRSWILAIAKKYQSDERKDTALWWPFINSLAILVDQISTDPANSVHLLYGKANLSKVPQVVRNVYVERVCRTICFLGYNIRRDVMTFKILNLMKSLRRNRHTQNNQYATVRVWRDIETAVRQSERGSLVDQMIQIYHIDKLRTVPPKYDGVRAIAIKTIQDVFSNIDMDIKPAHLSKLRPDAPSFTPRAVEVPSAESSAISKDAAQELSGEDDTEEPDEAHGNVEASDSDEEDPEISSPDPNAEAYLDSNAQLSIQKSTEPPSDEQIGAALIIIHAYRHYRSRRSGNSRIGLAAARERLFVDCLEEAQAKGWTGGYYRLLFLGPLPHALLCIQEIRTRAHEDKEKKKKRMNKVQHQELEDIMAQMTEASALLKNALRLQKNLQPKSDLHLRRDIGIFNAQIRETEKLFSSLPSLHRDSMQELQKDLRLAVRAISPSKPPAKKQKPELNTDDLHDA